MFFNDATTDYRLLMENFGFLQRLPHGGDTHDPSESESRDIFQAQLALTKQIYITAMYV